MANWGDRQVGRWEDGRLRQSMETALSLGERVTREGAFISRRGPGEGSLQPPHITYHRRYRLPRLTGMWQEGKMSQPSERPLTRRVPADESAGTRHPLPRERAAHRY